MAWASCWGVQETVLYLDINIFSPYAPKVPSAENARLPSNPLFPEAFASRLTVL